MPDVPLDSNANFPITFVHDSREIMGWKCRLYLTFVPDLTPSSSSGTTNTFVCFWFDLVELRHCCTLQRRLAATILLLLLFYSPVQRDTS